MVAALLAALLFSISAICGYRSSKQIGGAEANFWRICTAAICLALWAHIFGNGLSGTGPKAGGPHYLTRFANERTLTVNTTATGGNAALLNLGS